MLIKPGGESRRNVPSNQRRRRGLQERENRTSHDTVDSRGHAYVSKFAKDVKIYIFSCCSTESVQWRIQDAPIKNCSLGKIHYCRDCNRFCH